jgi:hypothetical protein
MKKVLTLAAVVEAATGLALIIVPSLIGRLLFGTEFTGVANPAARVTGIALRLLARKHRVLRHVDLQRARHALSSVSCHRRRMGRASLVASSCYTRASYRASRSRVVSIAKARLIKRTDKKI